MRKKVPRWTKEELSYLIANYSNTPTSVLAKKMNRKPSMIYGQAKAFGLKKSVEAREYSRKAVAYREETPALADIICFYDRRGVNIAITSKEVRCPVEQVEDILERCRADGTYERYARLENRAIGAETGGMACELVKAVMV